MKITKKVRAGVRAVVAASDHLDGSTVRIARNGSVSALPDVKKPFHTNYYGPDGPQYGPKDRVQYGFVDWMVTDDGERCWNW